MMTVLDDGKDFPMTLGDVIHPYGI